MVESMVLLLVVKMAEQLVAWTVDSKVDNLVSRSAFLMAVKRDSMLVQ